MRKSSADSLLTTLEAADKMYETGKYEECYNFLSNSQDINNIEIKWRICRAIYNMTKEDRCDRNTRKTLIFKAHDTIKNELNSHRDNPNAQKWYALILDAKSTCEGRKEKLEQLNTIKEHMDLAAELNPNDASLLHMLGELCYQVLDIPWYQRVTIELLYLKLPQYTYEDALEYFLKAETAQPRFYSVNLLRIGCCYMKINKQDQAKYYLKLAASYPAKLHYDHQAKREAADLLKKYY
ncbi:regulator of microtubule dynamics protein 1-like isoform X2 [Aricia agestis]|nr:regulator of microtubule dynamics protein 1-like isoform X2 [Aricia agestis]